MKAISLRPPWGWLMLHGPKELEYPKDFENRNWPSTFTGRIVIHQSKRWDTEGMEAIAGIDDESWGLIVQNMPAARAYGLLGESTFAEQVTKATSKWFFGRYAWPVSEPLAYAKPIPYRGRLGIFEVPDEVVEAARKGEKTENDDRLQMHLG